MADNYLEKKFEEFYSGRKPAVKHPGVSLDALLTRTRSCRGYDKSYKVHRLQLERIAGVCTKVASAMNRQPLRFRLITADDPALSASAATVLPNGGVSPLPDAAASILAGESSSALPDSAASILVGEATGLSGGAAVTEGSAEEIAMRPSEIVLRHLRLGAALPELQLPLPGTEPEAFIVICSAVPEDRYVDMDLGIAAQSMLLKASEMGLAGIMVCAFDRASLRQNLAMPLDPLAVLAIGRSAEKHELRTVPAGSDLRYYREKDVHVVPKLALADLLI